MAAFAPYLIALAVGLFHGWSAALDQLKGSLKWSAAFPREGDSYTMIVGYLGTVASIAWVADAVYGKTTAQAFVDRWLIDYDDDVLEPVRRPNTRWSSAATPTGRWLVPEKGSRKAAWDSILSAVTRGCGTGRVPFTRPWQKPKIPVRCGYMILTGLTGSGKTRTAVELARHLGQRTRFADLDMGSVFSIERLRRMAWFVGYHPDDPWDTGIVRSTNLSALASWKPARRTLLLLDDPAPGQCLECLAILNSASISWLHPVRLLIVNQTIPAELNLRRRGSGAWAKNSIGPPLLGEPVILGADAVFTDAEIAALGRQALGPLWNEGSETDLVAAIASASQRNPFLTELAIDKLKRGGRLDDVGQDALIRDRVERVLAGLKSAGLDEGRMEALRAIACGTLAGPHCPAGPVDAAFGNALPSARVLGDAFPGTSVQSDRLPMVQPQAVADMLVNQVIAMGSPTESASRIVRAGLRANPQPVLRAMLRLGGQQTPLGTALLEMPHDLGTCDDRILLAQTIIEEGMFRDADAERTAKLFHKVLDAECVSLNEDAINDLIAHASDISDSQKAAGMPILLIGANDQDDLTSEANSLR